MSRIAAVRPVIRTLVTIAAALVCVGLTPAAQEPAPSDQQPIFRGGVDSVTVDATVTDRSGRPVTDLTAEDFEIREDGKPQSISTFRLIQTDDGLDDARAARDILSSADHRIETAREDNRLFVIFLDDYHVRRENSVRVREQLAGFISELTAHDLVAIATPFSSVVGMTFSRNHRSVAGNVMGFEGRKYDYTPRNAIEMRYQEMTFQQQEQMRNSVVIAQLSNIAEHLGTLRDGRKTVVYVSEGMSGSLPAGVAVKGPSGMGGRTLTGATGNGRESYDFFENSSLMLDLQSRVFRAAARNNVSIYTLDPRGLTNFEFGLDSTVSAATDRRIVQESVDLLRTIAGETDGRAIVANNDPMPGLRQMVRDSSAYYLLAYSSNASPRDGKFHQIQVRVRRPGVEVRARKGYWAYTAEEVTRASAPPKPEASGEVTAAISELAALAPEGRGRAVSVWMGSRRGATERSTVTLAWEAPSSNSSADPIDQIDRISIVATTLSGIELFSGPVARASATGRPAGAVSFDAPPGPLRVSVTAENARGIRIDTKEEAFEVPDFTTAGAQLTTPFLYRGRTARDLQQVRASASPAPTVSPVFARAERVLVRFGAFGPGGTTPRLTVRLLNQNGGVITALPPPVAAANGEFEVELSFGPFPPGDYVVEIGAEVNGGSTKRFVALRVTG